MPRHPDARCPVCRPPLDAREDELWRAWTTDHLETWCRTHGVTPRQATIHIRRHGMAQPPPAGRLNRERARGRVAGLPPRGVLLLELLHRVRVAGAEDLAPFLFGADPKAGAKTRDLLERMAALDLVYRYWPLRAIDRRQRAPHPVWLLGRDAGPWVERTFHQQMWPGSFAQTPEDVREELLRHDIGANRVVATWARCALDGVTTARGSASAAIDARNWWGSRHLGIGLLDPATGQPMTMRPDGLVALSLLFHDPAADCASVLLPFFLEYDRGSRTLDNVTQQLAAYDALARSGAAGRRLPQLALPGVRLPVVMVFTKPSRRRGVVARMVDGGLPMAGVITMDEAAARAPGALVDAHAHPGAGDPVALVDALLAEHAALVAQRRVTAHSRLVIDRSGARARAGGFVAARSGVTGSVAADTLMESADD